MSEYRSFGEEFTETDMLRGVSDIWDIVPPPPPDSGVSALFKYPLPRLGPSFEAKGETTDNSSTRDMLLGRSAILLNEIDELASV